MTTVLQFPSDRVKRPTQQGPKGPASIIIFPGIRYERHMAGQPINPAAPSRGGVRKRK